MTECDCGSLLCVYQTLSSEKLHVQPIAEALDPPARDLTVARCASCGEVLVDER